MPVSLGDTNDANNTVLRSFIGTYNPAVPVDGQTRLLIQGVTTTVRDTALNATQEEVDVALWVNGPKDGLPGQVAAAVNMQDSQGLPHGIIDFKGGITGDGDIQLGVTAGSSDALPLSTVVLHNNSNYTGNVYIDRGNVILKNNLAFGTPNVENYGTSDVQYEVRIANPQNHVGFNLIVEPGEGETAGTVNRVLDHVDFNVAHDTTVKGNYSLTLTGDVNSSNSAGFINLLPAGEELLLTGRQYTESTHNIYTWDGSGLTRVTGQLRNADLDGNLIGQDSDLDTGTRFRKRGTGTLIIESSQHGNTNTFKYGSPTGGETGDPAATIIVEGGTCTSPLLPTWAQDRLSRLVVLSASIRGRSPRA